MTKLFNVKLLDYMGSDMACANYARQSFTNPEDVHEVPEGYTAESALGVVNYCGRNGHSTPFRHPHITISFQLPIFIARQIGKHQTGFSWSEKSMRYTTNPAYYTMGEWRAAPNGSIKQGSAGEHKDSAYWTTQTEALLQSTEALYNEMIEAKVAPEQARSILPQSMMVDVVWTGSLLAFSFMVKQRADSHAQVEAQWFAEEVREVVEPLYPFAWKALTGA